MARFALESDLPLAQVTLSQPFNKWCTERPLTLKFNIQEQQLKDSLSKLFLHCPIHYEPMVIETLGQKSEFSEDTNLFWNMSDKGKWREKADCSWLTLSSDFSSGWRHPPPRVVDILTNFPARHICHYLRLFFHELFLLPYKPVHKFIHTS